MRAAGVGASGLLLRAGAALCLLFVAATAPAASEKSDCRIGSYRLSDGRALDIAPSEGDTLRWRLFSGETGQLHPSKDGTWTSTYGWTTRPDGKTVSFSGCTDGDIKFGKQAARRIAFDIRNTAFESGGVKLIGRLILPRGGGKVPVVVLVHGSEHDSALKFYALQRMFPAQGIGAFVYDKRGTGASGGQ